MITSVIRLQGKRQMNGKKKKAVIVGIAVIIVLILVLLWCLLQPKKEGKETQLPVDSVQTEQDDKAGDNSEAEEDEIWVDGSFPDETLSQEPSGTSTEDTWTGKAEERVENKEDEKVTDDKEDAIVTDDDVVITNDNDNYLPIIPPEFD